EHKGLMIEMQLQKRQLAALAALQPVGETVDHHLRYGRQRLVQSGIECIVVDVEQVRGCRLRGGLALQTQRCARVQQLDVQIEFIKASANAAQRVSVGALNGFGCLHCSLCCALYDLASCLPASAIEFHELDHGLAQIARRHVGVEVLLYLLRRTQPEQQVQTDSDKRGDDNAVT